MNLSRKPKLNLTENIKRLINLPTDYPQKINNKKESIETLFFMERETRLELATSSLARRHSTTELPPLISVTS